MSRHAATAAAFLPGGTVLKPGDVHVQPALSRTLWHIASKGANVFYEGWIAEDIVASLRSFGGLHTVKEMAAFRPRYEAPISTGYRNFDLWGCPPNGSGAVALAMASLLKQHDLTRLAPLSVERYHLQAEIARIAYAERDAFVCGPDTGRVPVDHLISPARALALSERISPSGRLSDLTPLPAPEHKNTVFLTVVDPIEPSSRLSIRSTTISAAGSWRMIPAFCCTTAASSWSPVT